MESKWQNDLLMEWFATILCGLKWRLWSKEESITNVAGLVAFTLGFGSAPSVDFSGICPKSWAANWETASQDKSIAKHQSDPDSDSDSLIIVPVTHVGPQSSRISWVLSRDLFQLKNENHFGRLPGLSTLLWYHSCRK